MQRDPASTSDLPRAFDVPRAFDLLPAIDLLGGRVVRLERGDFDHVRGYGDDPPGVAAAFADQGATWLHVVDLDGARTGERRHDAALAAIVEGVADRVRVETAGGLRSRSDVDAAIAAGAARVVLGTQALRQPAFAAEVVDRHGPDRVAAALDVRGGQAFGDGWLTGSGVELAAALDLISTAGIRVVEVTSIERDGLLGGPDLELMELVTAREELDVIASGGIRSIADLEAVRAAGCRGAIIGRALYEGTLGLREAIAAFGSSESGDIDG